MTLKKLWAQHSLYVYILYILKTFSLSTQIKSKRYYLSWITRISFESLDVRLYPKPESQTRKDLCCASEKLNGLVFVEKPFFMQVVGLISPVSLAQLQNLPRNSIYLIYVQVANFWNACFIFYFLKHPAWLYSSLIKNGNPFLRALLHYRRKYPVTKALLGARKKVGRRFFILGVVDWHLHYSLNIYFITKNSKADVRTSTVVDIADKLVLLLKYGLMNVVVWPILASMTNEVRYFWLRYFLKHCGRWCASPPPAKYSNYWETSHLAH